MILLNIQYEVDICFYDIKYLERKYNCIHFKLEYQIEFYNNQNIY